MLGDIENTVELSDFFDKELCFLFFGKSRCFKPCDIGKLCKRLISGFTVEIKNIRQNNGICKPVRSAVHTAEIVCDCVNIADISSCECNSRKI